MVGQNQISTTEKQFCAAVSFCHFCFINFSLFENRGTSFGKRKVQILNQTFYKHLFTKAHSANFRLFWLVVVISAMMMFLAQVGQRSNDYFLHKSTVDVKRRYVPEIDFPSVTICNQNQHRFVVACILKHVLF